MDPKEIVRTGYDALSLLYRKDAEEPPNHQKWTSLVLSILPSPPTRVLDIGCGCGVPIARDLANMGCTVTGVDLSAVQIDRARNLVPRGTFIQADITSPSLADMLGDTKFSAIIALYVLIHIPVGEQEALMHKLSGWLVDGGYCIMTTGITPWTDELGGWLGADESVKMWWSQAGVNDYRRWAKESGFEILRDEHVPEEGNEGHQFFLLKKASNSA